MSFHLGNDLGLGRQTAQRSQSLSVDKYIFHDASAISNLCVCQDGLLASLSLTAMHCTPLTKAGLRVDLCVTKFASCVDRIAADLSDPCIV